jgi:hypothetical protein
MRRCSGSGALLAAAVRGGSGQQQARPHAPATLLALPLPSAALLASSTSSLSM